MAYERLMEPITVKKTTFPNRIVLAPIQTSFATPGGETTERLIKFHENIAMNSVGLSIVGATDISPKARLGANGLGLYEERQSSSLEELFDRIRKAGSIPAIQLNHGGRVINPEINNGMIFGPSAIASAATGNIPRELSIEEIEELINRFATAAGYAKKAGASMVEFHGTHGLLLNQFMSAYSNHRTDIYGGSTENRARIVRNILRRTREKTGNDFLICLRINADEFLENGLTVNESSEMVKMFIEDGLDIVHVSAGGADTGALTIEEGIKGNLIKLAGEIKKQVNIPVIGVGGIKNLDQAEQAIEEGHVDMVAMCRALIVDPELVTKTLEGRVEDLDECTDCMECIGGEPGINCQMSPDL
ncbi:MAG: NADH:flavin oxidoreductase [Desulfobacterales bacterium]|jgi:2,4-dienoyl-CoA reductase-like NADH-dependent reductase (Old Yellow Enzyme family)|nr:NADH:flavin oxidoreductase [Desulfobacteraceae bacterium]MBT7086462.1 NADH:flavin oxidoreductase [Desulfobacterales bacterium]MBT7698469.1 NADH:flavin oxidoreductase [Desulfobacterales bacterium]